MKPNNDILITAEDVSKKFCKDFKRSLWYGLKDIGRFLVGNDIDQKHLRRDEFWAVEDVSFELRRGECLGLIGHNGAGKSTLLKMLNGLINPDSGKITMNGKVGALIELGAGFNPILTGKENIYNNGAVLGFSKQEIDKKYDAIVDFSELGDFIHSPVQNYSSGMKVRLGFAVAAQMEPDILLIDEVLAVGDVGFRFKCLNAIGDMMKNSAVIFVSHAMPQIYRVCNQVMLLEKGKSIYQSPNLGEGIDLYYKMFSDGEQQISGSGDVKVNSLEMETEDESAGFGESISVKYMQSLRFKLGLRFDKSVQEARLQLVVWNQELLPVMDIVNEDLLGALVNKGDSDDLVLNMELKDIQLNAGKYTVSVILNSTDLSKNYCRFDKAGIINMATHSASGAHILATVNWEICN